MLTFLRQVWGRLNPAPPPTSLGGYTASILLIGTITGVIGALICVDAADGHLPVIAGWAVGWRLLAGLVLLVAVIAGGTSVAVWQQNRLIQYIVNQPHPPECECDDTDT